MQVGVRSPTGPHPELVNEKGCGQQNWICSGIPYLKAIPAGAHQDTAGIIRLWHGALLLYDV